MEAPKVTLAMRAMGMHSGQSLEVEGRRMNEMVSIEPMAAKVVRRRCRV